MRVVPTALAQLEELQRLALRELVLAREAGFLLLFLLVAAGLPRQAQLVKEEAPWRVSVAPMAQNASEELAKRPWQSVRGLEQLAVTFSSQLVRLSVAEASLVLCGAKPMSTRSHLLEFHLGGTLASCHRLSRQVHRPNTVLESPACHTVLPISWQERPRS